MLNKKYLLAEQFCLDFYFATLEVKSLPEPGKVYFARFGFHLRLSTILCLFWRSSLPWFTSGGRVGGWDSACTQRPERFPQVFEAGRFRRPSRWAPSQPSAATFCRVKTTPLCYPATQLVRCCSGEGCISVHSLSSALDSRSAWLVCRIRRIWPITRSCGFVWRRLGISQAVHPLSLCTVSLGFRSSFAAVWSETQTFALSSLLLWAPVVGVWMVSAAVSARVSACGSGESVENLSTAISRSFVKS